MKTDLKFEKDRDVLQAAVDRWGIDLQAEVAIEELAELIRAIARTKRFGVDRQHPIVLEKLAGAQIMIWQLALGNEDKVQSMVNLELKELRKRINSNDY